MYSSSQSSQPIAILNIQVRQLMSIASQFPKKSSFCTVVSNVSQYHLPTSLTSSLNRIYSRVQTTTPPPPPRNPGFQLYPSHTNYVSDILLVFLFLPLDIPPICTLFSFHHQVTSDLPVSCNSSTPPPPPSLHPPLVTLRCSLLLLQKPHIYSGRGYQVQA
jgi:hypothetical protein